MNVLQDWSIHMKRALQNKTWTGTSWRMFHSYLLSVWFLDLILLSWSVVLMLSIRLMFMMKLVAKESNKLHYKGMNELRPFSASSTSSLVILPPAADVVHVHWRNNTSEFFYTNTKVSWGISAQMYLVGNVFIVTCLSAEQWDNMNICSLCFYNDVSRLWLLCNCIQILMDHKLKWTFIHEPLCFQLHDTRLTFTIFLVHLLERNSNLVQ